jgi:hypothetical protein
MTEDPKPKPPHDNAADDLTLSYVNAPGDGAPAPTGVPLLQSPPNAVFSPGQVLGGRFKVIRFVARGGMGEVYEAEDQELNERVAVKTARFKQHEDARDIERFRREIQLARKVTHPNICRTFDVFRHSVSDSPTGADGEILIVSMELLEGKSLDKRVRGSNRMTTTEAFPIVTRFAWSLPISAWRTPRITTARRSLTRATSLELQRTCHRSKSKAVPSLRPRIFTRSES